MDLKEYILSSLVEVFTSQREAYLKIVEQADKIITWIVGFSIASIVLSLSKSKELSNISESLPSLIIIFSCLTVIIGVLYRVFVYIAQNIEYKVIIGFGGYVDAMVNMEKIEYKIPKDKIDGKSPEELISTLKTETNIDHEIIDSVEDDKLRELCKEGLEEKYYDSVMDEIKEIIVSQLGISNKKARRMVSNDEHKPLINDKKIMWFFANSSLYLFIITSLLFICGVSIFLITYIRFIMC